MIEFLSSPKGQIASFIFDKAVIALGAAKASNWMFAPNTWLNGRSPIQAIRQGDDSLVRDCVEKLNRNAA